jgi:class 3 adenylate cyclase/streptogramin lyase
MFVARSINHKLRLRFPRWTLSGMLRTRRDHLLATVMFTDMVGSAEVATELGNRRWRVLLDRHHVIVRRALKRHGGKEIDNAGDGFFAAFHDQADAIRCACEISDAVKELGIDIRAGLHVGQAEIVGRKLGGLAVNAGARLMSQARPGEVLVSGVMRDLVAGSGFTFEDRGSRTLKGIPGEWHVFAVSAVEGATRQSSLKPAKAAELRGSIRPPPLMKRRVGRALAVALVVAVLFIALLFTTNAGKQVLPQTLRVDANSLIRIDPATGDLKAVTPIAAPGAGQLTAVTMPREIWVGSPDNQVISRVDADENESLDPFGGFGRVRPARLFAFRRRLSGTNQGRLGIVSSGAFVWTLGNGNSISKIDSSSLEVLRTRTIAGAPDLLAKGFGRVWVLGLGEVASINTRSLAIDLRIPTGDVCSNGIAVGEGAVWVSNPCDSSVLKIDPRSGATTRIPVGGDPSDIGIGFGSVWVSDMDGTETRIDPQSGRIEDVIAIGEASDSMVSGSVPAADYMWATSPSTKSIVWIDPATNDVEGRIHLPYSPLRIVAAFGSIWVTVAT